MDMTMAALVGAAAIPLGFVVLSLTRIEYYPVLFFVVKFAASRLIDFERVRYSIAFQFAVIGILLVFALIRHGAPERSTGSFARRMKAIRIVFVSFVLINSVVGIVRGWSKMEVVLDTYKYLEAVLYYIFFSWCWRSVEATERGIKLLIKLTVVMGLIEIPITSRGGVAIGLVVSMLPILAFYGYEKRSRSTTLQIASCLAVVVASTTRTYIVGVALSLLLLIALVTPRVRYRILVALVLAAVASVIVMFLSGGELLGNVIARLLELSQGFDKAGGYRASEYPLALGQWMESPWFGQGFGYERWLYVEGMGYEMWGSFMHNAYLEILLKAGLLGVAFLLPIMFLYIKAIFTQCMQANATNAVRWIAYGGIFGTAGWIFIYAFAPLSSYGSLFIGCIISTVMLTNSEAESVSTGVSLNNLCSSKLFE